MTRWRLALRSCGETLRGKAALCFGTELFDEEDRVGAMYRWLQNTARSDPGGPSCFRHECEARGWTGQYHPCGPRKAPRASMPHRKRTPASRDCESVPRAWRRESLASLPHWESTAVADSGGRAFARDHAQQGSCCKDRRRQG